MASAKSEEKKFGLESPEPEAFTYDGEGDGRVRIVECAETSKFLPGDRVWYMLSSSGSRQGPYLVVKGPSAGKYYLAAIDNISVRVLDGKVVSENELEEAKI